MLTEANYGKGEYLSVIWVFRKNLLFLKNKSSSNMDSIKKYY